MMKRFRKIVVWTTFIVFYMDCVMRNQIFLDILTSEVIELQNQAQIFLFCQNIYCFHSASVSIRAAPE